MGLLDITNPDQMGLLNASAGLLNAAGPQRFPVSLGQALGQGLQGYTQGYGGAQEMAMKQAQMQMALRRFQMVNDAMQSEGNTPQAVQPPAQQTPPGLSASSANAFGLPGSAATPDNPVAQQPPMQQTSNQNWPEGRIRAFAMSGDPGLMKSAEMEQARQLAGQTDIGKLLDQAGIDKNSALGKQIIQQQIAKQGMSYTRLGEGAYADASGVHGLPAQAPAGFINITDPSNPSGFKTVGVPGSLDAATTSKGALERASQGEKIEMVKTASGAMVPMRLGDVVGSPASSAAPLQPRSVLKPQGTTISDPWASMPKMQNPGGIGQSTYQAGLQEGAGKQASALTEKYSGLADSANQRTALNNQALSLLNNATTGPGAAKINEVKNFLVSRVGIPETTVDKFSQGDITATTAIQKDLVNAATAKAKQQFGARITQSEVQLMLTKGNPSVDMTKAAIQYLVESDNAAAKYQIQQASDLGKYISNSGDPYQFEAWYAKTFPMTNALSQVHPASPKSATTTPQSVPSGMQPTTVTAPNGRVYSFPDAQSAANFKLKAGF